jgi:hypothetical protein
MRVLRCAGSSTSAYMRNVSAWSCQFGGKEYRRQKGSLPSAVSRSTRSSSGSRGAREVQLATRHVGGKMKLYEGLPATRVVQGTMLVGSRCRRLDGGRGRITAERCGSGGNPGRVTCGGSSITPCSSRALYRLRHGRLPSALVSYSVESAKRQATSCHTTSANHQRALLFGCSFHGWRFIPPNNTFAVYDIKGLSYCTPVLTRRLSLPAPDL